jgi:2-methylisocitrate lyase-like PEP mutase family enzyme
LPPGQPLLDLIRAPGILAMPGVFDGYSVRLTEQAGFEAAFVTGAGLSEALLGQSDVGLMGLETVATACRLLALCSSIPLLADADTGYGNAVNVYHTVRALEQAGVAGVMIEDQTWPKRCGHMAGKSVIDAAEMAGKVQAAIAARRDPAFVIMARTDAMQTHGLPDAIDRLNRYREAGADLLFADALPGENDIATVAKEVAGPVCVNMGFGIRSRSTTPLVSARRLEELGVAVVTYPRLLTGGAIQGMRNGLAALRTMLESGETTERPDLAPSFDDLNDLMGLRNIRELEKRFTAP